MLRRLRRHFFTGLLVTAPLFIAFSVALWLIDFVDSRIVPLIPEKYNPNTWFSTHLGFEFGLPGIGVVIMFVIITFIGALTTGLLGRTIMRFVDWLGESMPVVRTVYSGAKQVISALLNTKRQAYKQALLVEFPYKGIWAIAFLTNDCPEEVIDDKGEKWLSVYVPTTPNPTGGYLLFVKESDTKKVKLTTEEAFKYVVSTGVIDPKSLSESAAGEADSPDNQAHPQTNPQTIQQTNPQVSQQTNLQDNQTNQQASQQTSPQASKPASHNDREGPAKI